MIKKGQNGVFLQNDENMVSDQVFGGFPGDPKNSYFSAFSCVLSYSYDSMIFDHVM